MFITLWDFSDAVDTRVTIEWAIPALRVKTLKQFTYLGFNISSTENDSIIHLAEILTAIDKQLIIGKFLSLW